MTTTATATATAANTKSGDAAPTLMDMDAYMLMPTQASPLPAGKLDGALDDAVAVSTPIPGGAPPCAMPGWFPYDGEQARIWGAAAYPSGESPYRWWVDEAEEEARPLKRAIEKEMMVAAPEEEEMEEGEVSPCVEEEAVERAAEEVIDVDAESAPEKKRVRIYFSGEKMWVGAPKPKARKAAKKPKALRMRLPESGTSLAEGARVYGLVGAKATERRRLIEAARELRGASAGWAKAIEETLNELRDAQAPLLSFGRGAGDGLRRQIAIAARAVIRQHRLAQPHAQRFRGHPADDIGLPAATEGDDQADRLVWPGARAGEARQGERAECGAQQGPTARGDFLRHRASLKPIVLD